MQLNFTKSRIVGLSVVLCVVVSVTVADRRTSKPGGQQTESRRLLIRSGTLYTKDGVPINLSGFDSEIQSDKASSNNSIPQTQIRDVVVRSGQAFVRVQDLAKLLRSHISGDKITDLSVETDGSEVKISGSLRKAIPTHFEIKGPVSVSPSGQIDLHESSKKVDKLPMALFGVDTSSVIGNSHSGISATKDDILLDPNALWGMSVHGKLTEVKLVNNGLVLVYGTARVAQTRKSGQ
jgi:hypothetical protein